jgi:acetolactate synthase-1/2/3 large subunit
MVRARCDGRCVWRKQDRKVVLITGDGCFRMNSNELATMQHYGIPVVILVMNNGFLAWFVSGKPCFTGNAYSQTNLDRGPDFAKLADAYRTQRIFRLLAGTV